MPCFDKKLVNNKPPLPVDAILPEIVDSLKRLPNLVIEAPPGAGKTTRVPPALLKNIAGEVVVLEPRRIAARLSARRVAWEMGEQAGETVGYRKTPMRRSAPLLDAPGAADDAPCRSLSAGLD